MKAIIFKSFGASSVLESATVPTPKPSKDEVLIRISHTSVNPVDWKIREGYLQKALPHVLPIIPGWDAAGEIAEVGEGVRDLAVGESVYAYTRLPEVHAGTYAEYIVVPASFVARRPATLTAAEAAAVPLVGLTAYQALTEFADVKAGDRVLVTAGSGGVGSFAIQFAKALGAHVTATAGSSNQAYLRELGADEAIDYVSQDVGAAGRAIAPQGFDVVLDAVGGTSLAVAAKLVKDGGRLVSIVDTPSQALFDKKTVKHGYHFVYPNGAQLAAIGKLIDAGKVVVPAVAVRSVKEAAAAQDENQKRHVRGKLVLAIDL